MSKRINNKIKVPHKKCELSDFICTQCYNITKLSEVRGEQTAKYSTKKMYCYVCKENTKHMNIKDKEITEKVLEVTMDRDFSEEKAFQLIKKSNNRRSNDSR